MSRSQLIIVVLIIALALFYPTLKAVGSAFRLLNTSKKALISAQDYSQHLFSNDLKKQQAVATSFKNDLNELSQNLIKFNTQADKSWIARQVISSKKDQLLTAQDLISIAQDLLSGEQTYALLFQNSEELRATGGFLGSYAIIKLSDGVLIDFKIEDIYVPDGQFEWFIEAPTGAKEYLSGGNGLKLRDANWQADFSMSAQQILTYLAWGKEAGIDGAVAVNLPLVEKILAVTGPIFIRDYDQTITHHNFSDVARADRGNFFPGSIQKQHFLDIFFNQLLIKLENLDYSQQKILLAEISTSAIQKDLQFYSNDQHLQSLFEKLAIAGILTKSDQAGYLMLVESNVGINKANQHLDRAINLKINDQASSIEVTFVNRNPPPASNSQHPDEAKHLGYVNYQRLILDPSVNVSQIEFDGQPIPDWDEELIKNSKGQMFKQIGFLITVPEQETKKMTIFFDQSNLIKNDQIFIQKQAGIDRIPYHLDYYDHQQGLELTKDTLVNLNK